MCIQVPPDGKTGIPSDTDERILFFQKLIVIMYEDLLSAVEWFEMVFIEFGAIFVETTALAARCYMQ
jgi:hypothetical protein